MEACTKAFRIVWEVVVEHSTLIFATDPTAWSLQCALQGRVMAAVTSRRCLSFHTDPFVLHPLWITRTENK